MSIISKLKYWNQVRKYCLTMLGADRREEIKKVNFEPCAVCNINCAYCNFEHKNKRRNYMHVETLKKVLNELLIGSYNLRQVSLSQSGEVLLHPQFKKLVRTLKQFMNYGLQTRHVVMNTNLMLLDKATVDFLLDVDVFTRISCSIDGKDKDTFERLRVGAKYEQCIKNFEYLAIQKIIRGNKNLEIRINNGNDKKSNMFAYDKKMLECFGLADKVIKYDFHEWTGNIKVEGYKPSGNKGFCQFMFNTVLITTDGEVAKCCNDLNGSTVYGSIKYKSLKEVYHSKERKKFLKLMYKKERKSIPGCDECTRM